MVRVKRSFESSAYAVTTPSPPNKRSKPNGGHNYHTAVRGPLANDQGTLDKVRLYLRRTFASFFGPESTCEFTRRLGYEVHSGD